VANTGDSAIRLFADNAVPPSWVSKGYTSIATAVATTVTDLVRQTTNNFTYDPDGTVIPAFLRQQITSTNDLVFMCCESGPSNTGELEVAEIIRGVPAASECAIHERNKRRELAGSFAPPI
jgi:hypothetical protein